MARVRNLDRQSTIFGLCSVRPSRLCFGREYVLRRSSRWREVTAYFLLGAHRKPYQTVGLKDNFFGQRDDDVGS